MYKRFKVEADPSFVIPFDVVLFYYNNVFVRMLVDRLRTVRMGKW